MNPKINTCITGKKIHISKNQRKKTWGWSYWLLHKEIEKLTLHHSLTSLNGNFIVQMSFHSVSSSSFFKTPFQASEGMRLFFSITEKSLENYQLIYGSQASSLELEACEQGKTFKVNYSKMILIWQFGYLKFCNFTHVILLVFLCYSL